MARASANVNMPASNVSSVPGPTAEVPPPAADSFEGRFDLGGGTLRERTARGVLINAAFQVGFTGLELLKRLAVVAFLTQSEFGFWGILIVSLSTVLWLKQIGISDKYIQQADEDQETAFQKAFTLELCYTLVFWVLLLAAIPLYALIYGRPEILLPGFVLSVAILASPLQTPTWIYYRRMQFARQRMLEAVNPVVTFAVTVSLAVAGFGYWSLVAGSVIGNAAAALVAVRACPYRLALKFDRRTLREYFSFSWPLLIVSGSSLVIVQASVLIGEATVGLAGVGVIGLAGSIAAFTNQVDGIVTRTIYPAVCAVRERTELLFESFVKTNRLALMWGMPFGIGLTLFAPDLVTYVLGDKWAAATGLLQIFGVMMAANQIGFNWTAFMRARDQTRPLAVNGVLAMVTFLVIGVPYMLADGLTGFAVGMVAVTVVQLVSRTYYLTRLFRGLGMARHAARAMWPSVPPVAAVLAVRALEGGDRSLALALGELALYVIVTTAATIVLERPLLRELAGYVRGDLRAVPTPVK